MKSLISTVNPDNRVVLTSFWNWHYSNPVTYTYATTGGAGKWGSSDPDTTGGTVLY